MVGAALAVNGRGIEVSFGSKQVLQGVDVELRPGEIVGLVGLNGAGKSTLLRVLAGIQRPNGGTVEVAGSVVDGIRGTECGLMLEHPPFIDEFSGIENLWVLASLKGRISKADVVDAMASTGLDPRNRTSVRNYSQGMRQRLGLAQALMERPPVLLLDEPLNGLDPTGILDVRELILRAAADGAAVLFSSHVLSEVQTVCDRVLLLAQGELRELSREQLGSLPELESAYRRYTEYAGA